MAAVVFLALIMSFSGVSVVTNINTDEHALLSVKASVTTSWSSSTTHVCNWTGVICNRHGRVASLNLSNMGLLSTIPPSMGNLSFLVSLHLSKNSFSGGIPKEMSYLRRIKEINLNFNDFSGGTNSCILNTFNVSYNNLHGEIPSGGPFENFTSQSFLPNEALCGATQFGVRPCKTNYVGRMKTLKKVVIICVSSAISLIVLLFTFVLLRIRCQKSKRLPIKIDLQPVAEHRRITHQEILEATDGFDESNLLGNGSFESAYKGVLSDVIVVAIKVFKLQQERALKSFHVECDIIHNVRHRNLIKIVTSCSNLDFKALILEYMPNGSLEKWLYSCSYVLDILQRLDIMIDLACALDNLHHEYGLGGSVSRSCDIYSYGIMLMETFTGKKPTDEMFAGHMTLKCWVKKSLPSAALRLSGSNGLKIEKFIGMNFQWWKMQVEDYLYQKDLYLPLVGEKPEAMNANEWAILDRKVLATVRPSLTPQVAFNISKEKTATAVMQALEKLYEKPSASNKRENHSVLDCNKEGNKKNDCTEPKKKKGAREREGDDEEANMRITLWHHRLGHLSESGMRILHSKNALLGMKNIQLDFCEGCVYGKKKRVSFQRDGKEKKTERPEFVHTDVCGPTTVKSLGDDVSRKTWIYAIRQKSVIYHTFKKWNALVENEIGNKVPRIENPEVLDETTDTEIGAGDQQQVLKTPNLKRSNRLLLLRSRETRNERFPMLGGIVPRSPMFDRFKAATLPWRLQMTPVQLQTCVVEEDQLVMIEAFKETSACSSVVMLVTAVTAEKLMIRAKNTAAAIANGKQEISP
ncbi:hypothetical protein RJ640_023963 [Escallonia rubra]|uniref:Protein kinase domain-containing protein n=1 Tax=Escallonia rubra TaxID=112253 RepID=A0AA88ULQ6_9ASTE|nr:hypothetical protein RJ640_023963 [Escallonia rubra]